MPREQINYPSNRTLVIYKGHEVNVEAGDPMPDGGEYFADPELHVIWHPETESFGDGYVQVSLAFPKGFLAARAASDDDTAEKNWLYTPQLNRDELNRLIRTLRKARDRAYGTDE
ncbi:hypothetical protein BH09ACT9_BH09ACT9_00590 [soil metagenome]